MKALKPACPESPLAQRATRVGGWQRSGISSAWSRWIGDWIVATGNACDRSRLGFEGGSHLPENKALAALDKSTSKCIFSLCKVRAHASWPERTLSPVGGAESRCPLLPAIRALRGGKFNQGVYSVKNGVKRV
jgi:hypothetical protein